LLSERPSASKRTLSCLKKKKQQQQQQQQQQQKGRLLQRHLVRVSTPCRSASGQVAKPGLSRSNAESAARKLNVTSSG
jgi:hypothetical protein